MIGIVIDEEPFNINYIDGDFVKSVTKNIKVLFNKDIYYVNIEVRNTYVNNVSEIETFIFDVDSNERLTFKINFDVTLAYELVQFSKSEISLVKEFYSMMNE
jgi:hypothetical protein